MVRDKRWAPNRAVLNHPDQLATHILETTTTDKVPSCNQNLQQWCQFKDRNIPLNVERAIIPMSSRLNLNFRKIYLSSNVSIKRMGNVPKNSVSSQHSRQSKTYKTEQPYLSGV